MFTHKIDFLLSKAMLKGKNMKESLSLHFLEEGNVVCSQEFKLGVMVLRFYLLL